MLTFEACSTLVAPALRGFGLTAAASQDPGDSPRISAAGPRKSQGCPGAAPRTMFYSRNPSTPGRPGRMGSFWARSRAPLGGGSVLEETRPDLSGSSGSSGCGVQVHRFAWLATVRREIVGKHSDVLVRDSGTSSKTAVVFASTPLALAGGRVEACGILWSCCRRGKHYGFSSTDKNFKLSRTVFCLFFFLNLILPLKLKLGTNELHAIFFSTSFLQYFLMEYSYLG